MVYSVKYWHRFIVVISLLLAGVTCQGRTNKASASDLTIELVSGHMLLE